MTAVDYLKRRKAKEHRRTTLTALGTAVLTTLAAWGIIKSSSDTSTPSAPKETDRAPGPKIVHREEAPKQWVRHEVEEEVEEEDHQVDTVHHAEEAYEEAAPAPTQVRIIKRTVQTTSGAREYYENVPPPQPTTVVVHKTIPTPPQTVIIQQEASNPTPVIVNQGPSAGEIIAANIASHAAGAIIHGLTHHPHGGHPPVVHGGHADMGPHGGHHVGGGRRGGQVNVTKIINVDNSNNSRTYVDNSSRTTVDARRFSTTTVDASRRTSVRNTTIDASQRTNVRNTRVNTNVDASRTSVRNTSVKNTRVNSTRVNTNVSLRNSLNKGSNNGGGMRAVRTGKMRKNGK